MTEPDQGSDQFKEFPFYNLKKISSRLYQMQGYNNTPQTVYKYKSQVI